MSARTRLRAPMRLASSPMVEGVRHGAGRSRRMLRLTASSRMEETSSHARVMAPPTTTISGLKPTMRFEMPMPR